MKRTVDEWVREYISTGVGPGPHAPEDEARINELAERHWAIAGFLFCGKPEPEWPWEPKHKAPPEVREREIAEYVHNACHGGPVCVDQVDEAN